ncbi:retinoblastoma-binding protein [Anaeramoeba flamelloides]|uniref:Retinoblastoma-binding protein n=1 Tax=Anaeramoeba flamelloides TaxID=1746091 RepID=A0ABQ8Y9N2_9EUKA|nr:retinoblastoma-binding protein [Anaeramoeba flamelloides]
MRKHISYKKTRLSRRFTKKRRILFPNYKKQNIQESDHNELRLRTNIDLENNTEKNNDKEMELNKELDFKNNKENYGINKEKNINQIGDYLFNSLEDEQESCEITSGDTSEEEELFNDETDDQINNETIIEKTKMSKLSDSNFKDDNQEPEEDFFSQNDKILTYEIENEEIENEEIENDLLDQEINVKQKLRRIPKINYSQDNVFQDVIENYLLMDKDQISEFNKNIKNKQLVHHQNDLTYEENEDSESSVSEMSNNELLDDLFEIITSNRVKYTLEQDNFYNQGLDSKIILDHFRKILREQKKTNFPNNKNNLERNNYEKTDRFIDKKEITTYLESEVLLFHDFYEIIDICQENIIIKFESEKGIVYDHVHNQQNIFLTNSNDKLVIEEPNFSDLFDKYNESEIEFLILIYFNKTPMNSAKSFLEFKRKNYLKMIKVLKENGVNSKILDLLKQFNVRSISSLIYRIPKQLKLKKYKLISIKYQKKYIDENGQYTTKEHVDEIIYISPIHWVNYIIHSGLKDCLLDSKYKRNRKENEKEKENENEKKKENENERKKENENEKKKENENEKKKENENEKKKENENENEKEKENQKEKKKKRKRKKEKMKMKKKMKKTKKKKRKKIVILFLKNFFVTNKT